MPFPSEAMRAWCQNVERLREEMCRRGRAREDGFCQCEIGAAIGFAPRPRQAQLCSGLFWSIWTDQVLYTVSPYEFYQSQFRPTYRFPKLYSHLTLGHASPAFLLCEPEPEVTNLIRPYERPERALLLEDKQQFWGEVSAWLEDNARRDLQKTAEADFRDDLRKRFPEGFEFLWPA